MFVKETGQTVALSKELKKIQFMPDDFVIDNLQGILDSIELIEIRFAGAAL